MPEIYGPIRRWWMSKFFDVKFANNVSEEVRTICSRYGEQIVAAMFTSEFVPPVDEEWVPNVADDLYRLYMLARTRPQVRAWLAEQHSIREYRERWIPLRDLILQGFILLLIGGEIALAIAQGLRQERSFRAQQEVLTNLTSSSKSTADTLAALKQTTDRELEAMKKSSDAAGRGADEQGAATASKTLHLSERAYLGLAIRLAQLPKANEKLKCVATTHNSGKTPAVDTESSFNCIVVEKGADENAAFAQAARSQAFVSKTVVADGQAIEQVIDSPEPLSEAAVQSINEGNSVIYGFLRVTYKDMFGREHHSRACTFYDPTEKRMVSCATMNSAD